MAYNTIEDDDYINTKTAGIIKQMNTIIDGMDRFSMVLRKLADFGITEGNTHKMLAAYQTEIQVIRNKLSSDYTAQIDTHAKHYIDKVKTAGSFLYD